MYTARTWIDFSESDDTVCETWTVVCPAVLATFIIEFPCPDRFLVCDPAGAAAESEDDNAKKRTIVAQRMVGDRMAYNQHPRVCSLYRVLS